MKKREAVVDIADGCSVRGIIYDATGAVWGCEGGGNWCGGMPAQPGICERTTNITVPVALVGQWSYAFGPCRGSSFLIATDSVTYQAGLEPLGAGRIVGVTENVDGAVTIETILAGEGKFLSLWPTDVDEVFAYGVGPTAAESSEERCRVHLMP